MCLCSPDPYPIPQISQQTVLQILFPSSNPFYLHGTVRNKSPYIKPATMSGGGERGHKSSRVGDDDDDYDYEEA